MPFVKQLKEQEYQRCHAENRCPLALPPQQNTPCQDGKAGEYECSNVDLLAFVPLQTLGSTGDGNDIWGWTDPQTQREYAMCGCTDGTSFVDVTEPTAPQVLGFLRTHTVSSTWRDIKVSHNFRAKIFTNFSLFKFSTSQNVNFIISHEIF